MRKINSLFSHYIWPGQIVLFLAASIKKLVIGVSFGVIHNTILLLVLITTPIILVITAATFWLGGKISDLIEKQAKVLGGVVLILIGLLLYSRSNHGNME